MTHNISNLSDIFGEIESGIRFSKRKFPIPPEYRNSWRFAVLLLLLNRGRAKSLTIRHLHALWWAIKSPRTQQAFLAWARGEKNPEELIVRFDPVLSTTVSLAGAHGLISRTSTGKYQLTTSGGELVEKIIANRDILIREKHFLNQLPNTLSEKYMNGLIKW